MLVPGADLSERSALYSLTGGDISIHQFKAGICTSYGTEQECHHVRVYTGY